MTRSEDKVTVSVSVAIVSSVKPLAVGIRDPFLHSVPENDPEPYVTETFLPVLTLVEVFAYALSAPIQVLELPVSIIKVSTECISHLN